MSRSRMKPPTDGPCSCGCGKLLQPGNVKLCYRCESKHKKDDTHNTPLGWVTVACRGASQFCSGCKDEEEKMMKVSDPCAAPIAQQQAQEAQHSFMLTTEDTADLPTPPRETIPASTAVLTQPVHLSSSLLQRSTDDNNMPTPPRPSSLLQGATDDNNMPTPPRPMIPVSTSTALTQPVHLSSSLLQGATDDDNNMPTPPPRPMIPVSTTALTQPAHLSSSLLQGATDGNNMPTPHRQMIPVSTSTALTQPVHLSSSLLQGATDGSNMPTPPRPMMPVSNTTLTQPVHLSSSLLQGATNGNNMPTPHRPMTPVSTSTALTQPVHLSSSLLQGATDGSNMPTPPRPMMPVSNTTLTQPAHLSSSLLQGAIVDSNIPIPPRNSMSSSETALSVQPHHHAMRHEWISKNGGSKINRIKLCACGSEESCNRYCIDGVDSKYCLNRTAYACQSLLSVDCRRTLCKTCFILASKDAPDTTNEATPIIMMEEQTIPIPSAPAADDVLMADSDPSPPGGVDGDDEVGRKDIESVEWVEKYRAVPKPLSREEIISANLKRCRNAKRDVGEDLINGESLLKRSNLKADGNDVSDEKNAGCISPPPLVIITEEDDSFSCFEFSTNIKHDDDDDGGGGDDENDDGELSLGFVDRPFPVPFLSWSAEFVSGDSVMMLANDLPHVTAPWTEDANTQEFKVEFHHETRHYRLHYFSASIPSAPLKRYFYHDLSPTFPTPLMFNWWPADAASHGVRSAASKTSQHLYLSRCMICHPRFLNGTIVCVRVMQSTCDTPIIGLVLCNLRLLSSKLLSEAFKIVRENNGEHSRLMRGIKMSPKELYDEQLVEDSYVVWLKQTRRYYDPRRGICLGASESVWSKDDATIREMQKPDMEGKIKSYFFNYEKGEIDKHIDLYFRSQRDDMDGVKHIYPDVVEDAQGHQWVILKKSYQIEQDDDRDGKQQAAGSAEAVSSAVIIAPRKSLRSKTSTVVGNQVQVLDGSQQLPSNDALIIAELRKQLKTLQKDKDDANKANKQLEKSLKTANTQVTSAKNRVDQLETQLQSAKEVKDAQKNEVARIRKNVQDLEKKIMNLEAQNSTLMARIAGAFDDPTGYEGGGLTPLPGARRMAEPSSAEGIDRGRSVRGGRGRGRSSNRSARGGRGARSGRYATPSDYEEPPFNAYEEAEVEFVQRLEMANTRQNYPTPPTSKVMVLPPSADAASSGGHAAVKKAAEEAKAATACIPESSVAPSSKEAEVSSSTTTAAHHAIPAIATAVPAASNAANTLSTGCINPLVAQQLMTNAENSSHHFNTLPHTKNNNNNNPNNNAYNAYNADMGHAQQNFPISNQLPQQNIFNNANNCPTYNNCSSSNNNVMNMGMIPNYMTSNGMMAPNSGGGPLPFLGGNNTLPTMNYAPNYNTYGIPPNGSNNVCGVGASPMMNINNGTYGMSSSVFMNSHNNNAVMTPNTMVPGNAMGGGGFSMMNSQQGGMMMGNFPNFSGNASSGGMFWQRP